MLRQLAANVAHSVTGEPQWTHLPGHKPVDAGQRPLPEPGVRHFSADQIQRWQCSQGRKVHFGRVLEETPKHRSGHPGRENEVSPAVLPCFQHRPGPFRRDRQAEDRKDERNGPGSAGHGSRTDHSGFPGRS